MAARLARDIAPSSFVNIGIGMPELVVDYFNPDQEILLHSENGIIGMGRSAHTEEIDPDLINAGKKPITLRTGGSFFDHTTSFAIIRGGHLDYCVLGAFQVSARGDLANWSLGNPKVAPAVGGAMDLAVGARRLYVLMEHTTREGKPRILEQCTLPLTGRGVVDRIYTDLAVIDIRGKELWVIDIVSGLDPGTLQALTGARLKFD